MKILFLCNLKIGIFGWMSAYVFNTLIKALIQLYELYIILYFFF